MNELDKIAPALIALQAKLTNVPKNGVNPFFKNTKYPNGAPYPTLADVCDYVNPLATAEGLKIIQDLTSNAEGVGCTVIFIHTSGQTLKFGPLYLPASKHDPQGYGSCATYARRYTLMSVLNITGDDDDDANAGTEAVRTGVQATVRTRPSSGVEKSSPPPATGLSVARLPHDLKEALLFSMNGGELAGDDPVRAIDVVRTVSSWSNDEKSAVWPLLDSKTRTAYAKFQAIAASVPKTTVLPNGRGATT